MHPSPSRPSIAAVLILALVGLGTAAHAVEFEEKLKAPAMANAAALSTQAKSLAARFAEIRTSNPAQLITNNSLARQQFDLMWQLERAIDEHKPLGEMAELGVIAHDNGSYSIDQAQYPVWSDVTDGLIALTQPDFLDNTCKGLQQRGFRPEDIMAFREYLGSHDLRDATGAASHPLAIGFSRTVRKYDKLKLAVPDSLVISYLYQRQRISSDAHRAWAQGLLSRFDAQRVRILLSLAMETDGSLTMLPEDPAVVIPETLALVRQPDFEQRVNAEARGVAP